MSSSSEREVQSRFYTLMTLLDYWISARRDARLAWVSVAYTLGLPSIEGRSMTFSAGEMGVSKQAISKHVTDLSRLTRLPPSFYMKSLQARASYRKFNGQSPRA